MKKYLYIYIDIFEPEKRDVLTRGCLEVIEKNGSEKVSNQPDRDTIYGIRDQRIFVGSGIRI